MMKVINHPHGMHLKVKPWIEISDDDIYIINFDKVLTITETNDQRLIDIFNNYLEEEMSIDSDEMIKRNDDGTKITRKMGYISSVEEAREKLENIFKLKDIKES